MFRNITLIALAVLCAGVMVSCKSAGENTGDNAAVPVVENVVVSTTEEPVYYEKTGTVVVGDNLVTTYTFENGMELVLLEDHSKPAVSVYMAYDAGTRHETPATSGLAHLTEHALYIGTNTIKPGQHDEIIKGLSEKLEQAAGSEKKSKSEPNAYTRDDYVLVYDFNLPSKELETALKLESDRMRNVLFNEDAFQFEKMRLMEEEGRNQVGLGMFLDELRATAYQSHPYGIALTIAAGLRTNAEYLTIEDVKRFYNTYYQPDKCVLALVGDFNSEDALALTNKYFGAISKGPDIAEPPLYEPRQAGECRKVIPIPKKKNFILIGYHVPQYDHPDIYPLFVASNLMNIEAICDLAKDPGMFTLFMEFPITENYMDAGNNITNELERLKAGEFNDDDLEKVKAQMSQMFTMKAAAAERPYFSLGPDLATYELLGSVKYLEQFEDKVNAVTKEDIKRVANAYFIKENRTVLFAKGDASIKLKGRMGVELTTDPAETAKANGLPVKAVVPGSPAEQAKLQAGDIITSIDNTVIVKYEDLKTALENKFEGDVITVTYKRGEETLITPVTLAPRDEE